MLINFYSKCLIKEVFFFPSKPFAWTYFIICITEHLRKFVTLSFKKTEMNPSMKKKLTNCWPLSSIAWWRHQMETFSALLAICAGNSPVPGEFPAQRPVTRSFDVFFDLRPNKLLSKQSRGWWSETPSRPLWRRCNGITTICPLIHGALLYSVVTETEESLGWLLMAWHILAPSHYLSY